MTDTATEIPFADGKYRFWLPLPQIFELERLCGDVSIFEIEERLRTGMGQDVDGGFVFIGGGAAKVKEIRETIRLGLIGGNSALIDGEETEVGSQRARELVETYCYPVRPLSEGALIAWQILQAAIFGVRLKKKESESASGAKRTRRSRKAG